MNETYIHQNANGTPIDSTPKSFMAALMSYFGKLPGQTTGDVMAEIKKLTTEDREFFKAELTRIGYVIAT